MVIKRSSTPPAFRCAPLSERGWTMSRRLGWVLAGACAVVVIGQGAALAHPILSPSISAQAGPSQLLRVAKKKPIDKSCLMICEKWGDDGCLKWVMKCKGDTGYPRGGSNTRK